MVELQKDGDINVIKINHKRNKDWEQWVLLMSDEHFDSLYCDRKLLKQHHEEAKAKDAIILKFGDVFDMMGGKYDPRSAKDDIRPEYQRKDYFSAVLRDAAKFYMPYKDNIKLVSMGNHEAGIEKRHEIDILGDFCDRIGTTKGAYSGFIRFKFEHSGGGGRESKLLYYTHGSGGNAPVTRGVIKTNRRQNFIDADLFVSGHIHNEWIINLPMVSVSDRNRIVKREQSHISLGTYKDDSFTGGWADMQEFPPPNVGGVWLRFFWRDGIQVQAVKA